MDVLDLIAAAEKGLELVAAGRSALATVAAAIHDGKAALSETDHAALDKMLADEEAQTKASIADLREAIAAYRKG